MKMKRSLTFSFLFINVVTLIISTNKSGICQVSDFDLTKLSGDWEGTKTYIQEGACTMNGVDSLTRPSIMVWQVNELGNIIITDSLSPASWEGKIESDLSFVLKKGFWVNCLGLGRLNFVFVEYSGTIEESAVSYLLNTETTETWCPAPQSCIFRTRYSLVMEKTATLVENNESSDLPSQFLLEQNYPNPFNPNTEIRFKLPAQNQVMIKILNLLGHEIRTLVVAYFEAGNHSVTWDGKDNHGIPVSSGVYLYQLRTDSFSKVRKMSLLR